VFANQPDTIRNLCPRKRLWRVWE